jgi:photosystem II stability/assembly factor-like uncharacterized protein
MDNMLRFIIGTTLATTLLSCSDSTTKPQSSTPPDTFRTEVIDSLRAFPNARGVCFLDEKRGVVVTYYGKIGLTVDGGLTWEARESHTDQPLYAVRFVDDVVGYAVGGSYQDGVFLKTTDAGETWTRLTAPAEAELQAVCFIDTSRGYVVGLTGFISYTADGGQTWVDQYAFKGLLKDVFFVDEDTGFACGIRATILATTDGGQEWRDISPPDVGTFVQSIDFEQGVGFAAAGNRILKASDGGQAWTQIHELIGWVDDCKVVDANKLVAVGGGVVDHHIQYGAVHVSLDGGESWITDDETLRFTDLDRVNPNLVIGVGGKLIKIHFE